MGNITEFQDILKISDASMSHNANRILTDMGPDREIERAILYAVAHPKKKRIVVIHGSTVEDFLRVCT